MDWPTAAALALGVAVGLGISAALTARARVRVRRVRDGLAELAAGNLGHRVILAGDDDAARMAEHLNELADARQHEREVAGARDAAQRRLLANVSHDLRTPITSIAGYVDAIKRGLGDDPDRYLAIVAAKTDELIGLTDDLFYEARLDAGDLTLARAPIDLAEAVRRAVLGFEPQFEARGVRVTVDVPEDGCTVAGDGPALARVLGNLIANALRHGEGMTSFRVTMMRDGGDCVVRLTNDGADLPADVDRLFERGVAGRGGGAGLGLSIARELAGRMGATVTAECAEGHSVTFVLAFPEFSES